MTENEKVKYQKEIKQDVIDDNPNEAEINHLIDDIFNRERQEAIKIAKTYKKYIEETAATDKTELDIRIKWQRSAIIVFIQTFWSITDEELKDPRDIKPWGDGQMPCKEDLK